MPASYEISSPSISNGNGRANLNGTTNRPLKQVNGTNTSPPVTDTNGHSSHTTNGTVRNGSSTTPGDSVSNSLAKTQNVKAYSSYGSAPLNISPPPKPQEQAASTPPTRSDVESTFTEFAGLINGYNRPLPAQANTSIYSHEQSTGTWADMKSLGVKDIKTIKNLIVDKVSGQPIDDKEMRMEQIIQLVAALPDRSAKRVELTSAFLGDLWGSLQHPPLSYMNDDWKYRSADGTNSSYLYPTLGAVKMPYARSVNPVTIQPGALPDPALIFDAVLAREKFKEHPNRVSSIFFNWASLVIHDLFQTDHEDSGTSKTSSYLDLSILYGDTQEDQDGMRTFIDGRIKPDCFAEERLLTFPPSCGVMLIMLNRFHNHVVENLASINENGRFSKPPTRLSGEALEKAEKKRDNDLFQTGRLVTCGLYINIILYDYVRVILNLNRTNSTWSLDPRLDKGKQSPNDGTPRGIGNQVSAEFNLAYRWHSCIGETDEMWTEEVYQQLFGKNPRDVNVRELMMGLGKYETEIPEDPQARPFAGLKRNPDGRFDDGELAKIFIVGVEQVAGAFGAQNIPKVMKAITVLGIQQSRAWNMCTLNEYRKFFGLKTYDTFQEVNSDPYVAEQLKNLYEHPDYLELYPGFIVEDYKAPMVPGVGIAPNHTISRVVLSDAVALVRGDRFYTIDYSARHLTNWGFNEANYDLSFNQGCVFYKLLLRALPNHFKPNSIYAHYPMTVPVENQQIMKDLGRYHDYDWDRPVSLPKRISLTSYQSVKDLCGNTQRFSLTWNEGLQSVLGKGGERFCLGGDTIFHDNQRKIMEEAMYQQGWRSHIKRFYEYITLRLLNENTVKIAGINQIDITRHMGNLAPVHFAANMFDLPLKVKERPKGIFTEQEMSIAMCNIFTAISPRYDLPTSAPTRQVARKLSNLIGQILQLNIESVTGTSFERAWENNNSLSQYGIHMIRRLAQTGMSAYDMAFGQILPTATIMVAHQSQAFTQVIDFYLGETGVKHLPDIRRLAQFNTSAVDEELKAYINEALRLNGTFTTCRQAESEHIFHDNGQDIHVKPGDKISCNFVDASRDPKIFPDPDEVRLDRKPASYIHYGLDEHTSLCMEASMVGLTAMLRTVAKLKNLRRAPGPQGQLKKVSQPDGTYLYMREDHGSFSSFPCSLKLHYDGMIPAMPMTQRED